jgi:hypothetical protein
MNLTDENKSGSINEDLPLLSYNDIKRKYVIPSKRKK